MRLIADSWRQSAALADLAQVCHLFSSMKSMKQA
jgi:hypothetical protein